MDGSSFCGYTINSNELKTNQNFRFQSGLKFFKMSKQGC